MSALIIFAMASFYIVCGIIIWSDIQDLFNWKKFVGITLLLVASILCGTLSIVTDAEAIENRNIMLIKNAMGKTEYSIISSNNGIYKIRTPTGTVEANIEANIEDNKTEKKTEKKVENRYD